MEDLLIEILASFGYPVRLQGSMLVDEEYPKSFFTFWENESEDTAFYDDNPTKELHDYDVNFYSTDPELVYTVLKAAKQKLKQNGFIPLGSGHSVASDEETHTGRGINVKILEKQEE